MLAQIEIVLIYLKKILYQRKEKIGADKTPRSVSLPGVDSAQC